MTFDPNRSFWPDNSTCRCQDAYGMKCTAWCTSLKIPDVVHTIIKQDPLDPNGDVHQCRNLNEQLISCNFRGNSNGSVLREKAPSYKKIGLARACILDGLKNDEFVMTCMPESKTVRVDNVVKLLPSNTATLAACSTDQGNMVNCQTDKPARQSSYAIIKNETTCECFGEDPFSSCEGVCFKWTVPY